MEYSANTEHWCSWYVPK